MAIRGAAWRVSGEHVQPGQSAAPDRPHTPGRTLLPEGAYAARTETGGSYVSFFLCLEAQPLETSPSPPPAGDLRRPGGSEEGDRLQPLPDLPGQREHGDGPAAR